MNPRARGKAFLSFCGCRAPNGFKKKLKLILKRSSYSFLCVSGYPMMAVTSLHAEQWADAAFGDMWHCLVIPRKYVSKIQSVIWCSWVSGRFLDEGIWKICGVEIAMFLEVVQQGGVKCKDTSIGWPFTIF